MIDVYRHLGRNFIHTCLRFLRVIRKEIMSNI